MAKRSVEFVPGCYYHIFNRGANRAAIFQQSANYVFLLQRLKSILPDFKISVIAYCLMPNHYHFLLRQDGEVSISFFVKQIFNSYTKAYNKQYSRSGSLFEGGFRAIHVAQDAYLIHLCRYIHRNPLDAGLITHLSDWPYSNYLDWTGKRSGILIDRQFVASLFPRPHEYEQFVLDYSPPDKVKGYIEEVGID